MQQNGYSPYDKYCPFYKTIWMMRNFCAYYNLAQQTLEQAPNDMKITWNQISEFTEEEKTGLVQMKFALPSNPEEENIEGFKKLYDSIHAKFKNFIESLN